VLRITGCFVAVTGWLAPASDPVPGCPGDRRPTDAPLSPWPYAVHVLKGFRDFILRGNVVDLAVGIVIGAAFTALVSQFTDSFLKPLIAVFGGGDATKTGATFTVNGQVFDWGAFINAIITFALTAAVLYFLVVFPMNRLAERRKRGEVPPPDAPTEEVVLLTEIRDALVRQGAAPGRQGHGPEAMPPAPRRDPGRA
jgi:large conductance mechanosensitive channel